MGLNKDDNVKDYKFAQSRMMRDWSDETKPREKAIREGFGNLSTAELMALLFSTGIKGKSVVDMCQEILSAHGNKVSNIIDESVGSLCEKHKGIGVAKATTLLAAIELGKRAQMERDMAEVPDPLLSSEKAYKYMRSHLKDLQHEEFWVVYIDRTGRPICKFQASKGGTAATTVDIKIIMKMAVQRLASSMLLYHNHPSGTLRPSPEDDRLTKKIVEAASLFDIRVNDHIIITFDNYYSYCDNGRL